MKRIAALVLALALFFSCTSAVQAGNTRETKGYIALTFDDGPSGEITQQLLDGLAQRNVHATFFLCGYRIAQYPELAQRMAEDGHELGLSVIFWSVDPHDWDKDQSAQVLPYLLSHTQAGDIVLMHDLTEHSVSCALSFIGTMRAQGFEFCTVSELAALSGTSLSPGVYYNRFPH